MWNAIVSVPYHCLFMYSRSESSHWYRYRLTVQNLATRNPHNHTLKCANFQILKVLFKIIKLQINSRTDYATYHLLLVHVIPLCLHLTGHSIFASGLMLYCYIVFDKK